IPGPSPEDSHKCSQTSSKTTISTRRRCGVYRKTDVFLTESGQGGEPHGVEDESPPGEHCGPRPAAGRALDVPGLVAAPVVPLRALLTRSRLWHGPLRPVQGLPLGSWPRSVGLSREGDGSEIVFTRLVHHIERVVPPPAGLRRGAGHRPGRGQRLPNLDVLSVLGRCPRAIDGSRWKPVATGPGGVQGERPSGIVLQLDIP